MERHFQGYWTEMVGLKLDGRFSVHICQVGWGEGLIRGLTITILKSGTTRPETSEVVMVIVGRRTLRTAIVWECMMING